MCSDEKAHQLLLSQSRLPIWTPVDVVVTCAHMPIQHMPTIFATAPSTCHADDQKMYRHCQDHGQNAWQLACECDSLHIQLTGVRSHLANILLSIVMQIMAAQA